MPLAQVAKRVKPTFLIIGAAKSGTTSLYRLCEQHPKLFMSKEKELKYFSNDANYGQGWKWYESFFTGSGGLLQLERLPLLIQHELIIQKQPNGLPRICQA